MIQRRVSTRDDTIKQNPLAERSGQRSPLRLPSSFWKCWAAQPRCAAAGCRAAELDTKGTLRSPLAAGQNHPLDTKVRCVPRCRAEPYPEGVRFCPAAKKSCRAKAYLVQTCAHTRRTESAARRGHFLCLWKHPRKDAEHKPARARFDAPGSEQARRLKNQKTRQELPQNRLYCCQVKESKTKKAGEKLQKVKEKNRQLCFKNKSASRFLN